MTTESINEFAERMVRNEVLCCVSSLIYTLSQGYGERCDHADTSDLVEQAFELSSPVLDYESAAVEAGHSVSDATVCGGWEEVCCVHGIEPYESEVFEHWAVSTWFAEKLAEKGEKVDTDFAGLNVWARQCSGQAIAADAVVLKIARECMAPVERVDLRDDAEV